MEETLPSLREKKIIVLKPEMVDTRVISRVLRKKHDFSSSTAVMFLTAVSVSNREGVVDGGEAPLSYLAYQLNQ